MYNENITLVLPNRNLNVDHIGRIVFWYESPGLGNEPMIQKRSTV